MQTTVNLRELAPHKSYTFVRLGSLLFPGKVCLDLVVGPLASVRVSCLFER